MARLKPTASIKHPLRINKENVWDRKKALKHCVRKLRHIEDPETQLHQAVLLNNTLQRIRTMTSEPRVLQPASNNNTSLGSKESSLVTSEDIFSELSLPPPSTLISWRSSLSAKTIYQPSQQNTITAETGRRVFIVITTPSLIIIWRMRLIYLTP